MLLVTQDWILVNLREFPIFCFGGHCDLSFPSSVRYQRSVMLAFVMVCIYVSASCITVGILMDNAE